MPLNIKAAAAVTLGNIALAIVIGRSSLPMTFAAIATVELVIAATAALPVAGPRPGAFAEYRLPVIQSESREIASARRRVSLTLAAASLSTLLIALATSLVN